jgi:hypothetical protein
LDPPAEPEIVLGVPETQVRFLNGIWQSDVFPPVPFEGSAMAPWTGKAPIPGTTRPQQRERRRDQPPVPTQDRVRRHDGRNLSQNLATESLALHRQAAALAVSQPDTPPPQLLPKDAVLFNQIVDHVLLVAIDPSSEGQKQQPQG